MSDTVPLVSVIVETANWEPATRISLWDVLEALERQTYPKDRTEILLVLEARHHAEEEAIRRRHPRIRIEPAPPGLIYHQLKHFGAGLASGEILAMIDCDCLPTVDWVAEAVRCFSEQGPRVAAVQGATRFQHGALSRAWEASWWARGLRDEGTLDRAYSSNNLAMRREVYQRHPYPVESYLTCGLEAPLSRGFTQAGYQIWLNPRMLVRHTYTPSLREILQMGIVRGYDLMVIRRKYPHGFDHTLKRLGLLAPLLSSPVIFARDLIRLFAKAPRVGIRLGEPHKMLLYLLLQVPFHCLLLGGMYWAVLAPDRKPRNPH